MSYEPTEIEWAQLATWIDGEGYIGILHNQHRQSEKVYFNPRVVVYNTDLRIMNWLQERWGGTVPRIRRENPRAKTGFMWLLPAALIPETLAHILPYLLLKREQAQGLLDFYAGIKERAIGTAEFERRSSLHKHLLSLNRRGISYA